MVFAGGVGVDQASKARVRASLPIGQLRHGAGPLSLRRAENPGIALGALPAGNVVPIVVALLIVALLTIFVVWGRLHPAFALGCALATSGCAGNLLDRLLHGHVTDFFALGGVPLFNVADALIVFGFVLMLGSSVAVDLREPRPAAPVSVGATPAVAPTPSSYSPPLPDLLR